MSGFLQSAGVWIDGGDQWPPKRITASPSLDQMPVRVLTTLFYDASLMSWAGHHTPAPRRVVATPRLDQASNILTFPPVDVGALLAFMQDIPTPARITGRHEDAGMLQPIPLQYDLMAGINWQQDAQRYVSLPRVRGASPDFPVQSDDISRDGLLRWASQDVPYRVRVSQPRPQGGELAPFNLFFDVSMFAASMQQIADQHPNRKSAAPPATGDLPAWFPTIDTQVSFGWNLQQLPGPARPRWTPALTVGHSFTTNDASLLSGIDLSFIQDSPPARYLGTWRQPADTSSDAWWQGGNVITIGGAYSVPAAAFYVAGGVASAVPQSRVNAMQVVVGGPVSASAGVLLMARLAGNAGVPITQASLSAIAFTVTDLTTGLTSAGTFPTTSVFNTLQVQDVRWTFDSQFAPGPDGLFGYNWSGVIPASFFPLTTAAAIPEGYPPVANRDYQIDLKFTPVSGEVFRQTWRVSVQPTFG